MERSNRKVRTGQVVSNKMQKTVVVAVERKYRHPVYGKVVRLTSRFQAHDERGECAVGDLVEIMETKPFSCRKNWRVVRVLGKGKLKLHELPKKRLSKEEKVDTAAQPAESGG